MITNEKQYEIAKSQIEEFQESLGIPAPTSENLHPKVLEAHKNAVNYQLQELMREVEEYESSTK